MEVKLKRYTENAVDLLIEVKNTRLTEEGIKNLIDQSDEEKEKQISYIAGTIESSWEFVDYVFLITKVSRAFTHQLVRTRTASFAHQSQRVITFKSENNFLDSVDVGLSNESASIYDEAIKQGFNNYTNLISKNIVPEVARNVLPQAYQSNIYMKVNLRTFVELVRKRISPRVQSEYKYCILKMVKEVLKVHPWVDNFLKRDKDFYLDEINNMANHMEEPVKTQIYKAVDKIRQI